MYWTILVLALVPLLDGRLTECEGEYCCPEMKDLAIITSIMPAVYCFTEIDQIADFKIYDESKSASEPVIIGKTKKTVIEGVKTDDYLQEYRANVKPGEYILQTAQEQNGFISRRRLLIDSGLDFELKLLGTKMEIYSKSEAVRVFIDTHVLIGQSSLVIALETSPQIRREVKVPKRRRRTTNQKSDLIAFVNLNDEEVNRIKKSGKNSIPYRYEYSTFLPGQPSPRIYDQRGGFYTPNDTNEDGSYDDIWDFLATNWIMVLVVTIAIVLIIVIVIVVICCVRKKKNESESRSRPNLNRSDIDYNPAAKRNPSNYYLSPRQ